MTPADVLIDHFQRVAEGVPDLVDGLSEDDLAWRPGPAANSIGWLVWHLLRVQDDHVADAAGRDQVWTGQGFAERFGLPFDDAATGWGQSAAEVAQLRVTAELLVEYAVAVHAQSVDYISGLSEADLDCIVDERWDPPVTLGVRLVSVVDDDAQHLGQAAYVRGLLTTR